MKGITTSGIPPILRSHRHHDEVLIEHSRNCGSHRFFPAFRLDASAARCCPGSLHFTTDLPPLVGCSGVFAASCWCRGQPITLSQKTKVMFGMPKDDVDKRASARAEAIRSPDVKPRG
jgi:hypothetical protein